MVYYGYMIKQYESISITVLKPHLFEYVRKVENSNKIIYIIKNSKIVAKLEGVSYEGEIKWTKKIT